MHYSIYQFFERNLCLYIGLEPRNDRRQKSGQKAIRQGAQAKTPTTFVPTPQCIRTGLMTLDTRRAYEKI